MQRRGIGLAVGAIALAVVLALPLPTVATSSSPARTSGPTSSNVLTRTYRTIGYNSSVDGKALTYYEWEPANYNASRAYPLAVFLHGLGYDGNELLQLASGIASIQNASDFQFLLISLNTRTLTGFYVNSPYSGPQEQDVLDAIGHEETIRQVNTSAVFIFGSSMGTIGAYSIAAHHPGLVRGIGAVAECPEMFMAGYFHYLIGQQGSFLTTTGGYLPNQSAQALSETYYLDSVRYYPTNYSHVLLYAVQGADDNRCPNNPNVFGYQQSNNTFLNSTCLIVKNWSQPPSCQTPFSNLSAANPGEYLWRYVYEPTGLHTLNDLAPQDMFRFWLGEEPTGLYCAAPGDTPFSCSAGPQVGAPVASPANVDLGSNLTLSVSTLGGAPPYGYHWRGLPKGCVTVNASSLRCQPSSVGTYNVSVLVVDSNFSYGLSPVTSVGVNPVLDVRSTGAPLAGVAPLLVAYGNTIRGGTLPVSVSWAFGDGGRSSISNVTHSYVANGTYECRVWVNDSGGASSTSNFTVHVGPLPLGVSGVTANRSAADIGQSVRFNSTAFGGSGMYTYTWSGLPPPCVSANSTAVSCVTSGAGLYPVRVTVQDSSGAQVVSPPFDFVVSTVPVASQLIASRTAVEVGQSLSFNLTIVGGAPPFSISWSGLPAGCASGSTVGLSCAPSAAGSFTVGGDVTDANGVAAQSPAVRLLVHPALTFVSLVGDPSPATVGQAWTVSAAVSGGAPPVSWSYVGLPPGCASQNASVILCTPSVSGTYVVRATATDTLGRAAQANLSVSVGEVASTGPATIPGTSVPVWLVVGVAAAAAVVLGLLALLWRRSRADRKPSARPAPVDRRRGPPPGN
ncbi:MAG TPA: PKD domain-containing protein [Thermoplasmata archaeon]|nr:PKD domain-containing protein [Thermoplasmata archaeon]